MSQAVARNISVKVDTSYVPGRSAPHKNVYFFSYHVTIRNNGKEPVQLLTRHWTITDATGRTEEVRGAGVVGEQPMLRPGEHFEYTSFCPLSTQVGRMHGCYEMVTETGGRFDVLVAPFTLSLPHAMN
ncbi:MAG: Co2+/Mg2+ efflux protein ApaG [Deltaproteobacteria bacterium]|nr:MAG: Co2+/Mg2+ efflux protein ApaG [Deltaproteobacteria bacterium]